MVKHYLIGLATLIGAARAAAQPAFTNSTPLLGHAANSGGCMAITDMDGDGLDDVVQLHNSKSVYVLYQEEDGSFTTVGYGNVSNSNQWGWAIADLAHDGHKDIVSGGNGDGTHLVNITSRGVYTTTNLGGPNVYQQNMSVADINNDSYVDVFACNDVGAPNLWLTDASGMPQINNSYINWATNPASDMSGNYGSCFTDFDNDGDLDLHIAKCRQGVNNSSDPRRWNRLFVNDGNNQYTDLADQYGVQDREQTWATDFGDFDNDGDMDMVSVEHSTSTQLFLNDGTGHFTNATVGSGLESPSFPLQCLFRDLDNDGFLDVLIAGGSEHYYKGHGDGTFTRITGLFPYSKAMHSFAFGDLNRDGFEDVYANYGNSYVDPSASNPDILWLNTPNSNHFFRVRLVGTTSNPDAIGARVTINGPWGTQIREVRSGESYGLVNSFIMHFGLGAETAVPTMTVRWPSGLEETFTDLHADQTITVVEGTCISPNMAITATPATLCQEGDEATLTAAPAGTYTWSNGTAAGQISVTSPGNYYLIAGTGNCTTQANKYVWLAPDETPTVSVSGETTICPLDQVVLTASAASSYSWSNGGTGQSIAVNTPGSYTVTVQGACAEFTSDPVQVAVLDAPAAPVADNVNIPTPGTAVLTAAGDSILWYDDEGTTVPIGAGSPWTSPYLDATTTFWCADMGLNGGDVQYGGRTDNSSSGAYHSNASYYLLFNTSGDMILKSVKVYANGAGSRTIALVDASGGATLAEGSFDTPDGESRIQLDWAVPANGSYGLRIVSGNPQLWRDGPGSGTSFPYDLGGMGSITGTNASSSQYYYFFYDWEVAEPATWCEGPRTPVEVQVGPTTGIASTDAGPVLRLHPNPAQDLVSLTGALPQGATVAEFIDVAGRVCLKADLLNAGSPIPVATLAPGAYTVRVQGDHAVANATFVKQ
ncbi:MAG TPA: FG-GAP-like repeat-containing protein [Flavobacteriales bacterium]|nr:FG-GAP-like repeat-containing protein [Flavobacteriales bacterium]HRP81546.1 FG-GAP-like repeat-containing protein [Flavobacteriales bacterium]